MAYIYRDIFTRYKSEFEKKRKIMKFWVVFLLADVALGVSLNENEMQKWVDNNIEIAQFVEQNRAEFGRIVAGINQASFLSTLVS